MRRVLILVVIGTLTVRLAHSADAREPHVTAWWRASNHPPVVAAPPPDVSRGELLVEGTETRSSVPKTVPQQSAVAALSFALSADEVPGALRLQVESSSPNAEVLACRVTAPFAATTNGAWSDVPAYDCKRAVEATVDSGRLEFGDVGHLQRDVELSVILLPASPGRVVIRAPDDDALEVIETTSASQARHGIRESGAPTSATSVPAGASDSGPNPYGDRPSDESSIAATPDVPSDDLALPRLPAARDVSGTSDLRARGLTASVLLGLLAPFALRGLVRRRHSPSGAHGLTE